MLTADDRTAMYEKFSAFDSHDDQVKWALRLAGNRPAFYEQWLRTAPHDIYASDKTLRALRVHGYIR